MFKKSMPQPHIAIIGILTTTFFLASCHKHLPAADSGTGCVTRLSPAVTDLKISGADLDSIYALFNANNLSTANLQFTAWLTFTTSNVLPGAYNGYQEQVQAIQFINGLPLFGETESFTFNAGVLPPPGNPPGYNPIGGAYTGAAPSGDTAGHQSLSALRSAFLAHLSQSYMIGGPANAKPFIPSASTYENACLDVTLGYLDASGVPGSSTPSGTALVKVWSVSPAPDSSITYYPLVYVADDDSAAWGVPFFVP
jgi:hypothetical protein